VSWSDRLAADGNARIVGVVRAGVGVAAVMELVASGPRILALADPAAVRIPIFDPVASGFYAAAPVIVVAWLVAGVAFAVGFRTTISGTVLGLVLLGMELADQQLYNNHTYLIAVAVLLLVAAGAGSAFSLDARRTGTDERPIPAWTIYALRAQLSIVYLFAALAKLNPSFLSGSVIAASLRREGIAIPEALITFEPMFVMSIAVIAAELFLAFALWSPRWRPAGFVVGLALHAGIVAVMHSAWDLATFGVATLALYVAFTPAARGGRSVIWDDSCSFCATWVRWFRRLDWLDALRFVPLSRLRESGLPVREEDALEALHVIGPRRITRGFAAVTDVFAVSPICFLWAPLLRIPPVAAIGERAYRRVAMRRTCRVDARPAESGA
jgi:predicted DCC family thiol-disulfide oxidoreductase YuxK